MSGTNPAERTQLERVADALLRSGYLLFALAIVALGIETFRCTGNLVGSLLQTDPFGRIFGPNGN